MKTAVGVFLAVIATGLINYATYLMKRELDTLPRIGSQSTFATIRAFLNCSPWLRAQGLQILGTGTHAVALALAPLSIVQPINASGICLLVLLAVTRLKERASAVDWMGIISIVVGVAVLGVTLVQSTEKAATPHTVVLWFFIVLMIGVSLFSLVSAFTRKDERTSSFLGIGVGLLVGLTSIFIKMAWTDLGNRWGEYRVAGFIFSLYFWMAIAITLFCMVLFQIALQRGSAIVVIPLVTGFSNMIPIVVGLLAFREPFPKTSLMIGLRLGSILLIIGGAILLSLRREGSSKKTVYAEDSTRVVVE